MYKYCIRVKTVEAPSDEERYFNRARLIYLLEKVGCLIHPEGYPVTVWAARPTRLPDLTRGATADLVEDMIESSIPDWWVK
jgi:hypothetical protein